MSRTGIQGFQSERLAQILSVRRLNQVQLASMIGVSPASVSKWYNGKQVPERTALERLAAVVNVMPEWFTRPSLEGLTSPLFRKNASAHVAAREMLSARLNWAQEIAFSLEEFVTFPQVNIPSRNFTDPGEITIQEIEVAATECRDAWNLGRSAIQNLALAAESAGIILVREETGIANIEGLSAWSNIMDRPFILLSADKANGYRSRFDLAHEVAHHVLHRWIRLPQVITEKVKLLKVLELQAHRFAGAFLLPEETFAAEVRVPPTLDDLLLLKSRWGVSASAIIMRMRALRILDDDQVSTLFKRRSQRWGGKSEPGDGDREPEKPHLLRRTFELLANESVMPLEAIPRHFGLYASDVEAIAGLPTGYFNEPGDIVQLSRLRVFSRNLPVRQTGMGTIARFPNS